MAHPARFELTTSAFGEQRFVATFEVEAFRHAAIKFITKTLAQRLRGAADDLGDVILTSSGGRAGLFFAASPAMPGFEIKACLVAPRGGRQVKAPGISVKTLSPE
jgi:hypothetical protein